MKHKSKIQIICLSMVLCCIPYGDIRAADKDIPVNISVQSNPINVILPTSIELAFDGKNVTATTATNTLITNNSNIGVLNVPKVAAKLKDTTWTLSSNSSDATYKQLPLDSKQLYLGFQAGAEPETALSSEGITPTIQINPKESVNFGLTAKTGGSSTKIDTTLVDVEFTFEYDKVVNTQELPIDRALYVSSDGNGIPWNFVSDTSTYYMVANNELETLLGGSKLEVGGTIGRPPVSPGFRSKMRLYFTLNKSGTISFFANKAVINTTGSSYSLCDSNEATIKGIDSRYNSFHLDTGSYIIIFDINSESESSAITNIEQTAYIKDLTFTPDSNS